MEKITIKKTDGKFELNQEIVTLASKQKKILQIYLRKEINEN